MQTSRSVKHYQGLPRLAMKAVKGGGKNVAAAGCWYTYCRFVSSDPCPSFGAGCFCHHVEGYCMSRS
ncbi:hypothetical protein KTO58_01730 [Chitinophaga pendula]|uniref:hypothetical protein n=1 Tax=Chitinophaga TaxID=79328 RepID=UPI0012FD44E2|nr:MULTISPECIES: hypothetical protein [Chitinophaga]UCJ07925.1 hypothetical protein KTO58_01730 [Chitinophaga pendula]